MNNFEGRQPLFLKRLQESRAPFSGTAEHLLSTEMGDRGMPQLQQVAGCGIPAFYIVNGNRIAVILGLLVINQHIGDAPPFQLYNIIILLHRREQNQTVNPVLLDQVVVLVGADAG
ncbi:hypothetical protein D3C74_396770 [compost metagenome]